MTRRLAGPQRTKYEISHVEHALNKIYENWPYREGWDNSEEDNDLPSLKKKGFKRRVIADILSEHLVDGWEFDDIYKCLLSVWGDISKRVVYHVLTHMLKVGRISRARVPYGTRQPTQSYLYFRTNLTSNPEAQLLSEE